MFNASISSWTDKLDRQVGHDGIKFEREGIETDYMRDDSKKTSSKIAI